MILSAQSIRSYVELYDLIDPYFERQLQPASYDLQLGDIQGKTAKNWHMLLPGEFVVASTLEKVNIHPQLVGRVEGKSTWARKGIIVHTAGFIDPGFSGQITLEITNFNSHALLLEIGNLIAQIAFHKVNLVPEFLYGSPQAGSHYQNQEGPTNAYN